MSWGYPYYPSDEGFYPDNSAAYGGYQQQAAYLPPPTNPPTNQEIDAALHEIIESYPRKWSKADFRIGDVLAYVQARFAHCEAWNEDDLLQCISIAARKDLQAAAFFHALCALTSHNRNAPSDVNWIGAVVRLRKCANAPERTYGAVPRVARRVLDELHGQHLRDVYAALCKDMKGRADFFDALDIDAVVFDQLKRRLSIDTPEQWVTELQRLTHFKPVSFFFQALCAAKGFGKGKNINEAKSILDGVKTSKYPGLKELCEWVRKKLQPVTDNQKNSKLTTGTASARLEKADVRAAAGETRSMSKPAEKGINGKGSLAEKQVDASSNRGREKAGTSVLTQTRESTPNPFREVPAGGKLKEGTQREEPRAVAVPLRGDSNRVRPEGGKEAKKSGTQGAPVRVVPKDRQDPKGMRQEVQSTRKPDLSLSKARAGASGLDASTGGFGKETADGDSNAKSMGRGRNKGDRQGLDSAGPTKFEVSARTEGPRPAGLQNSRVARGSAQVEQPPSAPQVGVAPHEREVRELAFDGNAAKYFAHLEEAGAPTKEKVQHYVEVARKCAPYLDSADPRLAVVKEMEDCLAASSAFQVLCKKMDGVREYLMDGKPPDLAVLGAFVAELGTIQKVPAMHNAVVRERFLEVIDWLNGKLPRHTAGASENSEPAPSVQEDKGSVANSQSASLGGQDSDLLQQKVLVEIPDKDATRPAAGLDVDLHLDVSSGRDVTRSTAGSLPSSPVGEQRQQGKAEGAAPMGLVQGGSLLQERLPKLDLRAKDAVEASKPVQASVPRPVALGQRQQDAAEGVVPVEMGQGGSLVRARSPPPGLAGVPQSLRAFLPQEKHRPNLGPSTLQPSESRPDEGRQLVAADHMKAEDSILERLLLKKNWEQCFECAVSMDTFRNPVLTEDGHTYEKKNIEDWLQNNDTSPITGEVLKSKQLLPNTTVRLLIEHLQKFGALPDSQS